MTTREMSERWDRYAAAVPVSDCLTCAASYTYNQLDAFELIAAGTWRCPCGGVVRIKHATRRRELRHAFWLHRAN